MLNKDQIKDSFEKKFVAKSHIDPSGKYHDEPIDKITGERKVIDDIFAHLSAQYEKLIRECLPPIVNTLEEVAELNKGLPSIIQENEYNRSKGWIDAVTRIRTSLQERGIKITI